MPQPVWSKPPKPTSEMTQAEREAWEFEVQADYLQDEMPYMSPNEIAAGLMADTEEFGQAGSYRIAAVLRRRASASHMGPPPKPLAAPPKGPKPPPIKSRPVKLAKPEEPPRLI